MSKLLSLAVILLSLLTGASLAADPLSPEDFTKTFIAKAETVVRDRTFTSVGPLEVIVVNKDAWLPHHAKIHLDNVYRTYVAAPESLDETLRDFIRGALGDTFVEQKNTRDQLLPIIRYREYVPADDLPDFASESFAGDMLVFYVFDQPDTTAFARIQMIEGLGLKSEELRALSLDNLRQSIPDPLVETDEGVTTLLGGGPYLTGLLLLDEYWTTSRFPHRGDPVVFVIGREFMIVTGSEEKSVIDALREQSMKLVEEEPYPISEKPIIRRNGRWEAY